MHFRTLSHACLEIGSNGKILLTDPWLVGSCYWRSWWNYPPVADEIVDQLLPDAIYISHIHWDHFHGPSLRRFPKDTLIIIPYERSTRISRDLAQMRFTNVVELAHGKSLDVGGGIRVTSYQFSPWGDSAVVIEADGITLLNANDAKLFHTSGQHVFRVILHK